MSPSNKYTMKLNMSKRIHQDSSSIKAHTPRSKIHLVTQGNEKPQKLMKIGSFKGSTPMKNYGDSSQRNVPKSYAIELKGSSNRVTSLNHKRY